MFVGAGMVKLETTLYYRVLIRINVNLSPLSFPQCTAQLQTFKLISFYPINCHHPLLVADVRKQSGPLLAARYNGVFPGATL